ncbi:hypothetical protein D3C78_442580 [compost metagenome]
MANAHAALASCRHCNRHDLRVEKAVCQGPGITLLRGQGKSIGSFPADVVVTRYVVGGFRHGFAAIGRADLRIGEARADGGVEQPGLAAISGLGLAQHERCAAHAFHATGQVQLAFTAAHRAGGVQHCRQAAGAQAVDRLTRDSDGQARGEQGIARDVAAVFTGLVGAAKDHVLDLFSGKRRARHQRLDHLCGEIVRAQGGKASGMAAKGTAQTVIDISVKHGQSSIGQHQVSAVSNDRRRLARRISHGLGR